MLALFFDGAELKEVDDFPGYFVSDNGYVYTAKGYMGKVNLINLRRMRLTDDKHGYYRICLTRNSIKYTKKVHRLVLEAFVGFPPQGMEACHNDGNGYNNRLDNLRWDTRSNNMKDAFKHGVKNSTGDKNPFSKLTTKQVKVIKYLLEYSDMLQDEIGEIFGVTGSNINKIHTGSTWGHIVL